MGCGQSAPSADQKGPDERLDTEAKTNGAVNGQAAAAAAPNAPAVPGGVPANATILFVLGGPGSGKGTQCDRIKERYEGVVHLSAGDLLRAEVASGSEVGQKCDQLMKEGALVPMSVTIGLLKNAMIQSGGSLFLIDGFPRALDQAESFEKDIMPAKAILFFDCTEEEMEKRLIKRGETSGRADDNAETIRKRFTTFVEQSLPVKTTYVEKGNAYVINACKSPDDVFEDVKIALDALGLPLKGQQQQAAQQAEQEGEGAGAAVGAVAGVGLDHYAGSGGDEGGGGGDEE